MTATVKRLLRSWLIGILVGTGIVAVTSPLFVRSYLPLRVDPVRQVWTLPPGQFYRWRSEGYANTWIGPLGMPGKHGPVSETPADSPGQWRVALWGDSQAEGVCVADADKLFAIAERLGAGRIQVFPLARSGEDAADWVTQMAAVEQTLEVDVHVLLTVDLEDLLAATQAPLSPPRESDVAAARASIAARLPAFVIQGARHLLTEADETTPRRLRFSVGPHPEVATPIVEDVAATSPAESRAAATDGGDADRVAERWGEAMRAIRAASSRPILILDAPVTPQIVEGRVVTVSESDPRFQRMKGAAEEAGLMVVSARTTLVQSARDGNWPHGFHNGRFGSGHLNRIGNTVVASLMVSAVTGQATEPGSDASEGEN